MTASRHGARRPAGPAAAARFAAAVAGRYRRSTGRPALLRAVLLRSALVRGARARVSVVVSPTLQLLRLAPDGTPNASGGATTARRETPPSAPTVRHEQALQRVRRTARDRGPELLVRRLVERHERVELEVRGAAEAPPAIAVGRRAFDGDSTRGPLSASGLPLELVVARAARRSAAATPVTAPALETWGQPPPVARTPPDPPKLDVEALTDQVMRSIDRRLLAYRERTGRV